MARDTKDTRQELGHDGQSPWAEISFPGVLTLASHTEAGDTVVWCVALCSHSPCGRVRGADGKEE